MNLDKKKEGKNKCELKFVTGEDDWKPSKLRVGIPRLLLNTKKGCLELYGDWKI